MPDKIIQMSKTEVIRKIKSLYAESDISDGSGWGSSARHILARPYCDKYWKLYRLELIYIAYREIKRKSPSDDYLEWLIQYGITIVEDLHDMIGQYHPEIIRIWGKDSRIITSCIIIDISLFLATLSDSASKTSLDNLVVEYICKCLIRWAGEQNFFLLNKTYSTQLSEAIIGKLANYIFTQLNTESSNI